MTHSSGQARIFKKVQVVVPMMTHSQAYILKSLKRFIYIFWGAFNVFIDRIVERNRAERMGMTCSRGRPVQDSNRGRLRLHMAATPPTTPTK